MNRQKKVTNSQSHPLKAQNDIFEVLTVKSLMIFNLLSLKTNTISSQMRNQNLIMFARTINFSDYLTL